MSRGFRETTCRRIRDNVGPNEAAAGRVLNGFPFCLDVIRMNGTFLQSGAKIKRRLIDENSREDNDSRSEGRMVVADTAGVALILIRNGPFAAKIFQVPGEGRKEGRHFPTPALMCNEVSARSTFLPRYVTTKARRAARRGFARRGGFATAAG